MTKPKILVTAAAGHTGSTAVYQLLEMGFPVRAFVRRRDVDFSDGVHNPRIPHLEDRSGRRVFAWPDENFEYLASDCSLYGGTQNALFRERNLISGRVQSVVATLWHRRLL